MHMSELPPPGTKLEAVQLTLVNGKDNPVSTVSSTMFITTVAAEKESAVSIANASVTIIRPFERIFFLIQLELAYFVMIGATRL